MSARGAGGGSGWSEGEGVGAVGGEGDEENVYLCFRLLGRAACSVLLLYARMKCAVCAGQYGAGRIAVFFFCSGCGA